MLPHFVAKSCDPAIVGARWSDKGKTAIVTSIMTCWSVGLAPCFGYKLKNGSFVMLIMIDVHENRSLNRIILSISWPLVIDIDVNSRIYIPFNTVSAATTL